MSGLRIGWALCGSFCTLTAVTAEMAKTVAAGHEVYPVFSAPMCTVNTRFGTAERWRVEISDLCGRSPLTTLTEVEPLGPKDMLDVLVVAPCTGSTLAKLAAGDSSTAVTLAVKSHLRRERPVVLAVSTNDALAGSFPAIAALKNRKHYYFVPMRQDAPAEKPNSLVADFSRIGDTVAAALQGKQLQPLFI
ncbi:MAG: dipicolinate synthase subunit B [Ruminococcaceae bacterium]|nr:dipicolinate synthase subunit B [Oscillospiraceae bacterium]